MAFAQPVPARRMRASDQDRQEAIVALGDHHAEGRLDLAEFTARMERAQESTYLEELYPLFADLPLRRTSTAVTKPRSHRPELGWLKPLLLWVVVATTVTAVLSFPVFPLWLLLGFWFFWGRPSGRNRLFRQDRNHPLVMPSSPPPRPW
ncbi:MAG: DUF1707 domain-containing protein [Candidatus Nanopelagicales bacterium]